MSINSKIDQTKLDELIGNIQFLSPNEPISKYSIYRVLNQMSSILSKIDNEYGIGDGRRRRITIWDKNITYYKDDIVLHFIQEKNQYSSEQGLREFAFILISIKDNNNSIPNYDIVDGIPDFTKSNWRLINPMSYLLQNIDSMAVIVKDTIKNIINLHLERDHGIRGELDLKRSLVRMDYSNLFTIPKSGIFSLDIMSNQSQFDSSSNLTIPTRMSSNGIMEYSIKYSFEQIANQQNSEIMDEKYYLQSSPILDESDKNIFSHKYTEDNLMSIVLSNGVKFRNLRMGTNIFHKQIQFNTPFINDEYCVFFDTYGDGQFVFGFNKDDLMNKQEPTYDQVVSMPMLMNKTASGFDIVLPIHTYFNSIQKYRIGVPWKNEFRLQAIGRYR